MQINFSGFQRKVFQFLLGYCCFPYGWVSSCFFFFSWISYMLLYQEYQLILVHCYCSPVSCASACRFSPTDHLVPTVSEVISSLELRNLCPTKSSGVLLPNDVIALLTGSVPALDCYPLLFHEVRVYRDNTAQ